ncbi:unnamed protein product, partial [Prorocentrum cordatum]
MGVFRTATKNLRNYEAELSWSARLIQQNWRRRGQLRVDVPRHSCSEQPVSANAMRSKEFSAPAHFGEACLWVPVHEWDTTVHKFTYSAKCETQVEVVYLKRRVVKEIMDIYSPWLEDRFEVFRKGVVRSLAATEASGRRGSTTAEEPGSSEGEDECADSTDDPPPATAGKEATQNAVVGAANRLRC